MQLGAKLYNQTLDKYRNAYADIEKTKSERSAMKEMAADAMGNLFQGKNAAKDFGKWLNQNVDNSTKSKIKSFIDNIITILKDLFSDTKVENLNIVQQNILNFVAEDSTANLQKALDKFRSDFFTALDETSEMTKGDVAISQTEGDVKRLIDNSNRKSISIDKFSIEQQNEIGKALYTINKAAKVLRNMKLHYSRYGSYFAENYTEQDIETIKTLFNIVF